MSQSKSGKSDYDIDVWDQILDEYESSLGLPKFKEFGGNEERIEQYLSMSRDQLEKLDRQTCAVIAYELVAYSVFIQRALNRQMARVNWAKENIKRIIGPKLGNYKGSWNQQEYSAIKDDDVANKLQRIKIYAQGRVDRLSFLASSLKNLGDFLKNLQYSKGE